MNSLTTIIFDFDGTLSTLRAGWEKVMLPFMKECVIGAAIISEQEEEELDQLLQQYIDESTGIQTIYQMRWLAETVRDKGWNVEVLDEWEYKAEYNRRLLTRVKERTNLLERGVLEPENYLMKGAAALLSLLQQRGIAMYVASGTDHPDVMREAELLGIAHYFQQIVGAPVLKAECSKEKVFSDLMDVSGLTGSQLAVIGDGKVEISLAKQRGALAIGLASDEKRREGIDPRKQERLLLADADWITGDFLNQEEWMEKLGC